MSGRISDRRLDVKIFFYFILFEMNGETVDISDQKKLFFSQLHNFSLVC